MLGTTDNHLQILDEYIRLVNSREEKLFLDVDTTVVSELRDDISKYLSQELYSKQNIEIIEITDNLFRSKAAISSKHYRHLISINAKDSIYLDMVLRSNTNEHIRSKSKWWYHLTGL